MKINLLVSVSEATTIGENAKNLLSDLLAQTPSASADGL